MRSTIDVATEPRACECCGADDAEILWHYQRLVTARANKWHFDVQNVICRQCGFVYVSPAYTDECLAACYADAHPYFPVDDNIGKHLTVLHRHTDGADSSSWVPLNTANLT